MAFIAVIIGWFVGEFLIGGVLFSVFGGGKINPNKSDERTYTWIGRIIGVVISAAIFM